MKHSIKLTHPRQKKWLLKKKNEPITGKTVKAPMPGSIFTFHRKTRRYGNQRSDCVILEAMKWKTVSQPTMQVL